MAVHTLLGLPCEFAVAQHVWVLLKGYHLSPSPSVFSSCLFLSVLAHKVSSFPKVVSSSATDQAGRPWVSAATGGTHPAWRRQQPLPPDPTSGPTPSFCSNSRWTCLLSPLFLQSFLVSSFFLHPLSQCPSVSLP